MKHTSTRSRRTSRRSEAPPKSAPRDGLVFDETDFLTFVNLTDHQDALPPG